jgi:hypothetical protein
MKYKNIGFLPEDSVTRQQQEVKQTNAETKLFKT